MTKVRRAQEDHTHPEFEAVGGLTYSPEPAWRWIEKWRLSSYFPSSEAPWTPGAPTWAEGFRVLMEVSQGVLFYLFEKVPPFDGTNPDIQNFGFHVVGPGGTTPVPWSPTGRNGYIYADEVVYGATPAIGGRWAVPLPQIDAEHYLEQVPLVGMFAYFSAPVAEYRYVWLYMNATSPP